MGPNIFISKRRKSLILYGEFEYHLNFKMLCTVVDQRNTKKNENPNSKASTITESNTSICLD